jgi:hypothetical protein
MYWDWMGVVHLHVRNMSSDFDFHLIRSLTWKVPEWMQLRMAVSTMCRKGGRRNFFRFHSTLIPSNLMTVCSTLHDSKVGGMTYKYRQLVTLSGTIRDGKELGEASKRKSV